MTETQSKGDCSWLKERVAVADAARKIAKAGLAPGNSGNVSMRVGETGRSDLMAITPSQQSLSCLDADQIPVVDFEIEPVKGVVVPSAESLMHVAIYRARPNVRAVIHTHPEYATAAAVAGMEIPPVVDEMVVMIGGSVLVSKYGFPGSQDLADNLCEALGTRNAALIRNHGAVGVGTNLDEAIEVCKLTERTAKIFLNARLLGQANEIPMEAVEAEKAIFRMKNQSLH